MGVQPVQSRRAQQCFLLFAQTMIPQLAPEGGRIFGTKILKVHSLNPSTECLIQAKGSSFREKSSLGCTAGLGRVYANDTKVWFSRQNKEDTEAGYDLMTNSSTLGNHEFLWVSPAQGNESLEIYLHNSHWSWVFFILFSSPLAKQEVFCRMLQYPLFRVTILALCFPFLPWYTWCFRSWSWIESQISCRKLRFLNSLQGSVLPRHIKKLPGPFWVHSIYWCVLRKVRVGELMKPCKIWSAIYVKPHSIP